VLHLEQQSSGTGDGTLTNGNGAFLVAAVGAMAGTCEDYSIAQHGGNGCPPHLPRRGGVDTDTDGDQPPHSTHKIEFPKFDGTGDPMAGLTVVNATPPSTAHQ
jgi:hypothetical protein